MTTARFGLQTAVVLLLVALVSWPETRQVRAVEAVWRTGGPLAAARTGVSLNGRTGGAAARGRRREIGWGSAGLAWTSAAGGNALHRKLYEEGVGSRKRYTVPNGVLALGGRLNAVLGYARTSLNAPIPHAQLVLRSIATGEVEARATADEEGRFTFLDLMPSGYIVELLGPDGSVVATSEVLGVDAGALRETVVRLSAARAAWLAAIGVVAPTASEPVDAAARTGIGAVTAPARTVSPQR